jgi:predicted NBD/HSP70 family sugar kinase
VILENDANAGAIGEAEYGAGKGCDPLFYMTLSTGIGGGIYHAGRVWHGANSYAGEIGHLTIRPDGPECLCGARGCFERMCCGLWLARDHGRSARELLEDPEFVTRYVTISPWAQGCDHASQPRAHRHRGRHRQGRGSPVYSPTPGIAAADHRMVRSPHRRGSSRLGR